TSPISNDLLLISCSYTAIATRVSLRNFCIFCLRVAIAASVLRGAVQVSKITLTNNVYACCAEYAWHFPPQRGCMVHVYERVMHWYRQLQHVRVAAICNDARLAACCCGV